MSKVFVRRFVAIAVAVVAICGIVLLPGGTASAAGSISSFFPDPNLAEAVREALGADSVNDAFSSEEAKKIKKLDISGCNITSLEGIDNLSALEELDCSDNPISSVFIAGFYSLKKVDISDCSELEHLELNNCTLSSLDVSNCSKLISLVCSYNSLTELNVSTCYRLQELVVSTNKLTSLDLSNLLGIKNVSCGDNKITDINLGYCPDLESLGASTNLLTGIDTVGCPKLSYLDLDENPLTFLDVSMNTKLEYLFVGDEGPNLLDLKDNKIYIPDVDSYMGFFIRSGVNCIVLTKYSWQRDEVKWVGNDQTGYTAASVTYNCTVAGEEDYKVTVPATLVRKMMKKPTCEEPGEMMFFANFDEVYARDGEEFSEEKLCYMPAATGHEWGEWVVTKEATLDSEGSKTRTCLNDPEHTETVSIPKLTPTPTTKPTATPSAKPSAKPSAVPSAKPSAKPTPKPDEVLSLDKTSVSIVCGKNATLTVLNGKNVNVKWTSSNSKIAAVDSKGKVTAKMAGAATITAAAMGKKMECKVTVLYKDVTSSKDFWYAPTNYLTGKGVVKGYADQTEFRPANDCTRAQMVTFLYRLQGEPKTKSASCKFTDVKKTDYFYKPVIWAVDQGITTGVSKDKFNPQGVCTRAQTVTFLWRMAGKPPVGSAKNPFSDVKKSDYFYKATLWASEKKILAGYSDGTFKPQGKCLRRQMVTFLYKYDKFVNGKG